MNDAVMGIMLPRKKWKQQFRRIRPEVLEYTAHGLENDMKVIFFSLDSVNLEELTCDGFEVVNNQLELKRAMKLPSILYSTGKIFKKKYIRMWRTLSQMEKITVINEHHVIKKRFLFELLRSHANLRKYMIESEEDSLTYSIFGQRDFKHGWNLTVSYAVLVNNEKQLYEEGIIRQYPHFNQEDRDQLKAKLEEISLEILNYLSVYYPGVYELGLEFSLNKAGDISFQGLKSKRSVTKDLVKWNKRLWKNLIHKPIECAGQCLLNTLHVYEANQSVWIKLKPIALDDPIIMIPSSLLEGKFQKETILKIGIKTHNCQIIISNENAKQDSSFHSPLEIYISSSLLKTFHLSTDFVYQMNVSDQMITIGPTIGFLLGEKNQLYHPKYMEKYSDRFGVYETLGGITVAFSSRSINWGENIVYGFIYNPVNKKWVYGSAPIPSAIYRRNFHQKKQTIQKLIDKTANRVFNSHRFTKLDLYYFQDKPYLNKHLPETHILTEVEQLVYLIERKQKVILKPVSSSRGRGIFVLEKDNSEVESYVFHDYREKYRVRHFLKGNQALHDMLLKLNFLNGSYLIQTYIPLMKVEERPFDVRVVMQKNQKLEWQCTGIECRVAGVGNEITNIARGGMAMELSEVIEKSGESLQSKSIEEKIVHLCTQFCKVMDEKAGHYAEFGIDIGLDKKGYPWLIEANIFPSFKGFKKMDYDTYLSIRYQPLLYAASIQGFCVHEEESENDI
jgi:glutathione synthase/RimK-type ligase-like ATP-grasp enzyme